MLSFIWSIHIPYTCMDLCSVVKARLWEILHMFFGSLLFGFWYEFHQIDEPFQRVLHLDAALALVCFKYPPAPGVAEYFIGARGRRNCCRFPYRTSSRWSWNGVPLCPCLSNIRCNDDLASCKGPARRSGFSSSCGGAASDESANPVPVPAEAPLPLRRGYLRSLRRTDSTFSGFALNWTTHGLVVNSAGATSITHCLFLLLSGCQSAWFWMDVIFIVNYFFIRRRCSYR
jgi:hypothetical protein